MTAETVIASDRMPNNIKAIQLLTAVYMVQVGKSRMKTVRYYRLFTVSHSTLYDVTSLLAVSLDVASRERLYSASGDNSNHDLRQLQNRINTLAGTRPEILRP